MPEPIKGIPEIYDEICEALVYESFMKWIDDNPNRLRAGQICETTINYAVDERWYLEIGERSSSDESEWLWKAISYKGHIPPKPQGHISVARRFGLEKNEHIVAVKTKSRPVILIRESFDDWFHPNTPGNEFHNWYAVPVFSYRRKHLQPFVERDQKLENPENFYLPVFYSDRPGMKNECAARFHTIQAIPADYLEPIKLPSSSHKGRLKSFQLSSTALNLLATHFYQSFNMFPELTSDEGLYCLFVEGVRDYYNETEVS